MIHAMLDLETLSGGTNGVIVSIGAVAFKPLGDGILPGSEFKRNIRIQSALDKGATVAGDTLRWWLEQDDKARRSLFLPYPLDESVVLELFREWYRSKGCEAIWGHGANFDLRLMREAYARYGQRPPWHWRDDRDTRTLFATLKAIRQSEPQWPANPDKHDALADARVQALVVQDAIRQLRYGSMLVPTLLLPPIKGRE